MMDATQRLVGQGCGKLILFGEHAVVWGQPAIVAGLPRGATAMVRVTDKAKLTIVNGRTGGVHAEVMPSAIGNGLEQAFQAMLDILELEGPIGVHVTIDVPIGAGLGSSAAMSVAAARALTQFVGKPMATTEVEAIVARTESIFHGNPSGIDQAAALGGGIFQYTRGTPASIEALWVEPVSVVVTETGPAPSTASMVEDVGRFHQAHPQIASRIDELVGEVVADARTALAKGDWSTVGELMNVNHGLLVSMGVSTPGLDRACHIARSAGALGAKLTGAGGGGCMFALAPESPEAVVRALQDAGFDAFEITIP